MKLSTSSQKKLIMKAAVEAVDRAQKYPRQFDRCLGELEGLRTAVLYVWDSKSKLYQDLSALIHGLIRSEGAHV